jgi:hypothetical protein
MQMPLAGRAGADDQDAVHGRLLQHFSLPSMYK